MVDVVLASLEAEANEAAMRWYAAMDPAIGVGSRHHTVPRFLLERFSSGKQVWVRDLGRSGSRLSNVSDLAITNFYTILVNVESGEVAFDGRFEQLLSTVEGNMASVLARIDVAPTRNLTTDDRAHLAQFLSFQLVRCVRHRMEVELIAEYWAKTMLSESRVEKATAHRASVQAARRAGRTPSRGNSSCKGSRPGGDCPTTSCANWLSGRIRTII